ncbi:MAG: DUF3108 domain-containing protein [Acidobacteriota bacterium]
MRKNFFSLLLTILVLVSAWQTIAAQRATRAGASKDDVAKAKPTPVLLAGEQLTYLVKWNDLDAAKVIMQTEQANSERAHAYRVEVKVDTVGVVKDIVTVKDRFIAFVDGRTLLPFRAERNILEGPKAEQGTTTFDQEKHLARVADAEAVPIAPQTHDIASLFWAIRNIDLRANRNEKIQAFNSGEKKMFATIVEVGENAEVKTAAGSFPAVQLAIKLQDQKQPSDKYAIRMWVTNDDRRLPVLITAQPPFGKVRMELIGSAGIADKPQKEPSNSEKEVKEK